MPNSNRKPLDCAPAPCGSCPYRRDVPPGVWDATEYEKLAEYVATDGVPHLGLFLCHQTHSLGRETVCRGWLTVERESVAVRLALARGEVTVEQADAPVLTPLYATGAEASLAGLEGVARPSQAAREMMAKLQQKLFARGAPDSSPDAPA